MGEKASQERLAALLAALKPPVTPVRGGGAADVAKRHSDAEKSCSATDIAAYRERVSSFTIEKWFAKPQCLSPLHCARYGWRNSGLDELTCVSCGAVASAANLSRDRVVKTVDDNEAKLFLVTAHHTQCRWRFSQTPLALVLPEPSSPEELRASLAALRQSIPATLLERLPLSSRFMEVHSHDHKLVEALASPSLSEGGEKDKERAAEEIGKEKNGVEEEWPLTAAETFLRLMLLYGWNVVPAAQRKQRRLSSETPESKNTMNMAKEVDFECDLCQRRVSPYVIFAAYKRQKIRESVAEQEKAKEEKEKEAERQSSALEKKLDDVHDEEKKTNLKQTEENKLEESPEDDKNPREEESHEEEKHEAEEAEEEEEDDDDDDDGESDEDMNESEKDEDGDEEEDGIEEEEENDDDEEDVEGEEKKEEEGSMDGDDEDEDDDQSGSSNSEDENSDDKYEDDDSDDENDESSPSHNAAASVLYRLSNAKNASGEDESNPICLDDSDEEEEQDTNEAQAEDEERGDEEQKEESDDNEDEECDESSGEDEGEQEQEEEEGESEDDDDDDNDEMEDHDSCSEDEEEGEQEESEDESEEENVPEPVTKKQRVEEPKPITDESNRKDDKPEVSKQETKAAEATEAERTPKAEEVRRRSSFVAAVQMSSSAGFDPEADHRWFCPCVRGVDDSHRALSLELIDTLCRSTETTSMSAEEEDSKTTEEIMSLWKVLSRHL